MPDLKTDVLYYGDNLEILRGYIPDGAVDLIYLDPPFNSQQQYNVLFKEPTGQGSTAQIRAFTDTWHWDTAAERTYNEIITNSPLKVSKSIEALRTFIGANDVMAYLVMMTLRLEDSFPGIEYEVIGEPKDLEGARALARQDPYQFQWWALSLVNALPQGGERKKGADEGIDGVISFVDDRRGKAPAGRSYRSRAAMWGSGT